MSLRRSRTTTPARPRRGGCAVWALAAIILIVVGVVAAALLGRGTQLLPAPGPGEDTTAAQPDWCPAVEVISIPGTWETVADDDPIHPRTHPEATLRQVTDPLQAEYAPERVKVFTVPYPAQFANRQDPHQLSYNESRQAGYDRTVAELQFTHGQCPQTQFVLLGFSQGAVIAGDLTEAIAATNAPVPARLLASAVLVADGRRVANQGQHIGAPLGGVGAEVALQGVGPLVSFAMPDAAMRGPRAGFGELDERVFTICAPDDHICDAPGDIIAALQRPEVFTGGGAIHAQYATNPGVIEGTTVPQWILDHVHGIIRQAGV